MEPKTYEEAFARLNEITARLEDSSLPLSELTSLYKEGTELERYCRALLDKTEKELVVLAEESHEAE